MKYLHCLTLILVLALGAGSAHGADPVLGSLQSELRQCKVLVKQLVVKQGANQSLAATVQRLHALANQLEQRQDEVINHLHGVGDGVSMHGDLASDRHYEMVDYVNDGLLALIEQLRLLPAEPLSVEILNLLDILNQLVPEQAKPLYGALPYGHLDIPSRAPVSQPELIPAYKGGAAQLPTDQDILGDDLAPISAAIVELAQSLEWSPLQIYDYVKNNIRTEWYYGVMKGAEETLRQKAGNDADQACLLVALLRSAGYPARYVRGVMEFFPDIERGKHLLGIDNEQELAHFLQQAGIPSEVVIQGGKIGNIRLEHIWVESFIPYANYRGVVADEHGKIWLALDTSIKAAGFTTPEPLLVHDQLGLQSFRDSYISASQTTTPLQQLTDNIDTTLTTLSPDKTYNDLQKIRTQNPESLAILPMGLQFEDVLVSHEYTTLPTELLHYSRFVAKGRDNTILFETTVPTWKLSNHPLAVMSQAETIEDMEIILSYGGLGNTPSYLVRLRPVLKLGDRVLATGEDGLPMGTPFSLTTELLGPGFQQSITNDHILGSLSMMAVVAGQVVMPAAKEDIDKTAVDIFHEQALDYIRQWTEAEDELARLLHLQVARPLPLVTTMGSVLKVETLLDTVQQTTWQGVYVDADLRTIELAGGVDLGPEHSADTLFMQLSSLQGSVLEHTIMEQGFGVESISTAKLLGLAQEQGLALVTITADNIDAILPTLLMADNIIDDIKQSVAQGFSVTIPQTEIILNAWTGSGYLKENPQTGECGWMLSGAIAGGMSVVKPEDWPGYYTRLADPDPLEGPNMDPTAAVDFKIIQATDNQTGMVGKSLANDLQVIILDKDLRPVVGAQVEFAIFEGGGNLGGQQKVIATSNSLGIAEASLTLGKYTKDNPYLSWQSGYTHAQQLGENIVRVNLKTQTFADISKLFGAMAYPDKPVKFIKRLGDVREDQILSWTGTILVEVVDQYENPISNIPVTYSVETAVEKIECDNPNKDQRPAKLAPTGSDSCVNIGGFASYDNCPDSETFEVVTSKTGAHVEFFLGATPSADYNIIADASGIEPTTFTQSTLYFGNCYGSTSPSHDTKLSFKYVVDSLGNNVTAAKVGTTIPMEAFLLCLQEKPTTVKRTFSCKNPDRSATCDQIVGDRLYEEIEFDDASVSFGGEAGQRVSRGVFQYDYPVGDTPGYYGVVIEPSGSVTSTVSSNSCTGCGSGDSTYSPPWSLDLYTKFFAVDIQTKPSIFVPVDKDGFLACELKIPYGILPDYYQAANTSVIISKGNEFIYQIQGDIQGEGDVTLGRGFWFEPGKDYSATVYLNYGSNTSQIASEKINFDIGPISIDSEALMDGKTSLKQGTTETLLARTTPSNRNVVWEIVSTTKKSAEEPAIKVDLVAGYSNQIKVDSDSGSGWVTLRASDSKFPCISQLVTLEIGCGCSETSGFCAFDSDSVLGSIHSVFSIGPSSNGGSAGSLLLKAEQPSTLLAQPQGLRFSSIADGETEVVIDPASETVVQLVGPAALADIKVIDQFSYMITLYPVTAKGDLVDGRYEIDPASVPITTWTIENPAKSETDFATLRITEERGKTYVTEYNWDEDTSTWILSKGNGQQVEAQVETINLDGDRVVNRTISNDKGVVGAKSVTTYHVFPWGEEMISKVVDPDGVALTTTYTFYEDIEQSGSYGRELQVTNADGSWQRSEYDELGRTIRQISNYLDAPVGAGDNEARIISYDYSSVDPGDLDAPRFRMSPRTTTETIQGIVVSKSFNAYIGDGLLADRQEISEQCATPACTYGTSTNQRTVSTFYLSNNVDLTTMRVHPSSGKLKSVLSGDGQLTSYTYETGTFTMSGTPDQWAFVPGDGWDSRQISTQGTVTSPSGIAGKTTRSISVNNRFKQSVFSETLVYTGSSYEQINWSANILDDLGRVKEARRSDGSLTETTWGCCSKDSETDSQGNTTTYQYDNLRRLISQDRQGPNGNSITTEYVYDAAGRRLGQTITAGALTQTTSSTYDSAGRLQASVDVSGLTTSYSQSANGLISTTIAPGGAEQISENYPDGQLKSVTGTGVIAQYYSYIINSDGSRTTKVNSLNTTSPRWQQSTSDMLGRTIKSEQPGATGVESSASFYDDLGRLIRTTTSGQPDRLYSYDELGNQIASGLDLDKSGILEEASADRISSSLIQFVKIGVDWWQESTSQIYASTDNATATTVATQRSRVTGLGVNGLTSEAISIDIHGNQTTSRSYLDRATGTVRQETTYPDSAISAVQISVGGYLQSTTSKTDLTTTFAYDDLGRRLSTTDPRTGTSITHYDAKGRVDYVEDAAGNRTSIAYDQTTGRKISQTNAANITSYFSYDDLGRITHTWGGGGYPVSYVYDEYGQRSQMHTFRAESGWDAPMWPTSAGTADVTTWHYDEASGLLLAKEDALAQKTNYGYTTGGRLHTRAWARESGSVTTTYNYDPQTAELTLIDYADSTADISFMYDRLGRKTTISDGLGERTFNYTPTLQLDSEVIVGGAYSATLTRQYDALVAGRPAGIILDNDYQVDYGFDDLGRFDSLSWQYGTQSGTTSYDYLVDSALLESVTSQAGATTHATTYSYEAKRNLKTGVTNKVDSTVVSEYLYEYDALGRRKNVKNSGTAFTDAAFSAYGYNDRNELVGADRYVGNDIADTSQPVGGEKRSYQYDAIGNRELASSGDGAGQQDIDYTANAVNQYEQVTGGSITDLSYDEDGNLVGYSKDGKALTLVFNAENRLVAIEPVSPVTGDSRSEFAYDYMGRRVSKTVSSWDGSGWQVTDTGYFIYDGWNLIAELDETGVTETAYVWGLDLSQSLQGAGGIGGLLARVDVAQDKTHFYAYDGNGNVGQLIDAGDGSLAAAYEYDPYGNVVKAVGSLAEVNPFRFSTKYLDSETDLYYYGYRYYVPELGRWVNRDPIGEEGGLNLYGFVQNDPIARFDYLGNKILSVDIKGSGTSEVEKIYPGRWRNDSERIWKDLMAGPKLGLHVGKTYSPTFISELCRLYGWCGKKGVPNASGLWKFEIKANWCGTKFEERPTFLHYVKNLKIWTVDKRTQQVTLDTVEPGERQDDIINQSTGISDKVKQPNGTFNAYAWDAPRVASLERHDPAQTRVHFQGDWRITIEDNESLWEAEISLSFSFDDDGNPGGADGNFSIVSEPRKIR